MAVPVPHTWTAGDNATSTALQTVTDTGLWNLGSATSGGSRKALAKLLNTLGTQTFASGVTAFAVLFDTETVDYANGHSTVTNTSRYTATDAGWHFVKGHIGTGAPAASTGQSSAYLAVNGTEVAGTRDQRDCNSGRGCSHTVSDYVFLNVGDYVEVWFVQNSGSTLTAATSIGFQCSMTVDWRSN